MENPAHQKSTTEHAVTLTERSVPDTNDLTPPLVLVYLAEFLTVAR